MKEENENLKAVKELGETLNGKFDAMELRIKSIEDIARDNGGKLPEELKAELTKLTEQHTAAQKELKEQFTKMQEQVDKIDIGSQYKDKYPVAFDQHIKELVANGLTELKEVGQRKRSSTQLNIKANMTLGAHFTGEVIDRDRLPGIFFDPTRASHIRSFMNVTPVSTDVLRYVQEDTYTDGAGTKAEGAAAGQTEFKLKSIDETMRKINTYLKISKEMMSDAPFIENYIRTRVIGKLLVKEDNQILYGDGIAPNLSGLKTNATAYSDLIADANVNRFDVIANAVTNTRNNEYSANLALVNATDYQKLILQKDSQKQYIVPNVFTGQPLVVNGARVVWNTAVTLDDFFVADLLMGATFVLRSDVELTFTNTDQDDFIKGFVTILVEERVGLPVHNKKAIIYSTFADALGLGTA